MLLPACGDGGGGGDDATGPASFAPADAPLYLEATIQPQGDQLTNARALIAKIGDVPILGTLDPESLIADALEKSAADSGVEFSYARDIKPWLGKRIGIAFPSFEDTEDPPFVIAIETSDEDQARASLARIVENDPTGRLEQSSYEGHDYFKAPEDEGGFGVVDGFLVFAGSNHPEPDHNRFEEAVDAASGASLGSSGKLDDAFAPLPGELLASAYLDFDSLAKALAESGRTSPAEIDQARALFPNYFDHPLVAGLGAGPDSAFLDVVTGRVEGAPDPETSDLLESVPADSFAVLGTDDPGGYVKRLIGQVERVGSDLGRPELQPGVIEKQFDARLGISLDDALAEFGDGVFYARGDLPNDIAIGFDVALVKGAGDSTTSAPLQILTQLGDALEAGGETKLGPPLDHGGTGLSATKKGSLPGDELTFINAEIDSDAARLIVAADREVASGTRAADESSDSLRTDRLFSSAKSAIGSGYALLGFARLGPILDQALDQASIVDVVAGDASIEQAVIGFLADKLGYVVAGERAEGDVIDQRFVVGLAE